ncbi:hypothetical protein [Streptomyces lonarensis]|uniref:Uncharacterized protein n=1 Tax=Streptomyces lonarensis TaxID=700599 RepID=A0A7X6HX57_9ACTN|nr:hypothetical protein [Streptomyces lonarensis]NJQ04261.1 hypothetical protein [Streptomyces lonarensis]
MRTLTPTTAEREFLATCEAAPLPEITGPILAQVLRLPVLPGEDIVTILGAAHGLLSEAGVIRSRRTPPPAGGIEPFDAIREAVTGRMQVDEAADWRLEDAAEIALDAAVADLGQPGEDFGDYVRRIDVSDADVLRAFVTAGRIALEYGGES